MRATGTQQLLKGVQRLFWFGVACVVLFKNVNMLTAFRHQDGACKKPNVCLLSSVATLSPQVWCVWRPHRATWPLTAPQGGGPWGRIVSRLSSQGLVGSHLVFPHPKRDSRVCSQGRNTGDVVVMEACSSGWVRRKRTWGSRSPGLARRILRPVGGGRWAPRPWMPWSSQTRILGGPEGWHWCHTQELQWRRKTTWDKVASAHGRVWALARAATCPQARRMVLPAHSHCRASEFLPWVVGRQGASGARSGGAVTGGVSMF